MTVFFKRIVQFFVLGLMSVIGIGIANRREHTISDYNPQDVLGYESAHAFVPPEPASEPDI